MRIFELQTEDNAVSPVIGVILMVAITVILAAVIGTFVLGMGEDINQNAQAGVSFSSAGNDVEVQLTSLGNVESSDHVTVRSTDCDWSAQADDEKSFSADGIGEVITVTDCEAGDKITVLAELNGNKNVIATHKTKG